MLNTCFLVIAFFSNDFLNLNFFIYNSQTMIKFIFMHDPLLDIPWEWLSCVLMKKQNRVHF